MIGIKHRLRCADILLELAALAPRQAQQDIKVVADHSRFGAHRLHGLELLELSISLGPGFLG